MRHRQIVRALVVGVSLTSHACFADVELFNSFNVAGSEEARQSWLDAMGIVAPQNRADFESGFTDGQNVHNDASLFSGLVIRDTDVGQAVVRSGSGVINGSNPVGTSCLSQNEQPFLQLDFSSNPVDYFGFRDIDHTGTVACVYFEGTSNYETYHLDGAAGTGDTAEFFAVWRNDMPRITRVDLDSSGDALWAIDNIEWGRVTAACPLSVAVQQAPFPFVTTQVGRSISTKALDVVRNFRDRVLRQTPSGRRLVDVYYEHGTEIGRIFRTRPRLAAETVGLVMSELPVLHASSGQFSIHQRSYSKALFLLERVGDEGSATLRHSVSEVRAIFTRQSFSDGDRVHFDFRPDRVAQH